MEIKPAGLDGLLLITPRIFSDSRGYFYESYNEETFSRNNLDMKFMQDNESCSSKHVLRGLHYQHPPFEQGKLVRVLQGSVLDIMVDIRRNSPTYGKYEKVVLSAANKLMLWIPPGFAHGFLSLENDTVFLYKCTHTYHKESESGIIWNDPDLAIDWGVDNPLVSEKDLELPPFSAIDTRF